MQNSFNTSFIPQQPLLKVEGFDRGKEPINLAMIIALVSFFVVLVVAGGVYYYHNQKELEIVKLSQELEGKEKLLDIVQIDYYRDVNLRMNAAQQMLNQHKVFALLFDFLEMNTVQNIELSTLEYKFDSKKGATIKLSALAPSYQAVFFQSESWREMKSVVDAVEISDIALAEDSGIVSFDAELSIKQSAVQYSSYFKDGKSIPSEHNGVTMTTSSTTDSIPLSELSNTEMP
ncbi:MAG: hypothetical protein UY04_C0047G0005 [Parcubacteria group bacterium GW2011_GWA2_47_7]|nr:MAG: hypothetical protein UY04_C0047G0005 [Parcubacteria group bacterium GW2011_GWA2_47_7]